MRKSLRFIYSLLFGLAVFLVGATLLPFEESGVETVSKAQIAATATDDGGTDEAIQVLYDSSSHAGLLGGTPQLPHFTTARRTVTPALDFVVPQFGKAEVRRSASMRYTAANRLHIPANSQRACEYYVFALREIII